MTTSSTMGLSGFGDASGQGSQPDREAGRAMRIEERAVAAQLAGTADAADNVARTDAIRVGRSMEPSPHALAHPSHSGAIDLRTHSPLHLHRPLLQPDALGSGAGDPLRQLLGTMRMGAVLVSREGRIAYLNDAGQEALDAQIGLARRGEHVVAVAPDSRRKLVAALNGACRAPFVDGAVLLSATHGSGVTKPLRVLSMERVAGTVPRRDEGLALLCIGSARQRSPEATMLAQMFGLTAAESALMAAVAGGERLHECAARRGVSLATVRAQLRNVFVKTGAATQADLTFIAWSIPGLWIN